MSNPVQRYNSITKNSKTAKSWFTPKELAQFHYFNPNGAYQAHKEAYDLLLKAVAEKKCNSGCLIAYDGQFSCDSIVEQAMSDKRVHRISVWVAADMLKDETVKLKAFLASLD